MRYQCAAPPLDALRCQPAAGMETRGAQSDGGFFSVSNRVSWRVVSLRARVSARPVATHARVHSGLWAATRLRGQLGRRPLNGQKKPPPDCAFPLVHGCSAHGNRNAWDSTPGTPRSSSHVPVDPALDAQRPAGACPLARPSLSANFRVKPFPLFSARALSLSLSLHCNKIFPLR